MKAMNLKKEKSNSMKGNMNGLHPFLSYKKFKEFSRNQERNHFAWLAFSFFIQGCVASPISILVIIANGNNFVLWIPCIAAFAATEIVSLAAMPTRITIPVLFAGLLTNLTVIILSFFI